MRALDLETTLGVRISDRGMEADEMVSAAASDMCSEESFGDLEVGD